VQGSEIFMVHCIYSYMACLKTFKVVFDNLTNILIMEQLYTS
jgi:hypothetical protein